VLKLHIKNLVAFCTVTKTICRSPLDVGIKVILSPNFKNHMKWSCDGNLVNQINVSEVCFFLRGNLGADLLHPMAHKKTNSLRTRAYHSYFRAFTVDVITGANERNLNGHHKMYEGAVTSFPDMIMTSRRGTVIVKAKVVQNPKIPS
jgi:hypothetical protein